MTIYQVIDEENNLVSEYAYREAAVLSAEEMTVWFSEHYYHVEEQLIHEYQLE